MKFIGQYIQQFIARFKSDVYLDDINSGTIASGGNLGLDSNNKIVKATASSGGISHDGSTANGILTFKDADEATVESNFTFDGTDALISSTGKLSFRDANSYINSPTANDLEVVATDIVLDASGAISFELGDTEFLDFKNGTNTFSRFYAESGTSTILTLFELGGDSSDDFFSITVGQHGATTLSTVDAAATAAHFEIASDGNITLDAEGDIALEAAGNDVTVDSDTLTITSSTGDYPQLKLLNTTDDDQASQLIFDKLRADDGVATGQNLGEIWFNGQDGSQNTENYAYIISEIDVATHGQESGKLTLGVASHDGTNQPGVILTGGSVSQEVDATVGRGAASVTTVSGTLTMGSTATINNSGVIQVAAQTVIDHDQLANYAANEHFTQANITTVGTINTGTWNGTTIALANGGTGATSAQDAMNALAGATNSGRYLRGNGSNVLMSAIQSADLPDASTTTEGVVELATDAEAVTATDTAKAVTPANLKARVSQIANIKGYVTLQNDIYDYANPYVTDDEAPFQLDKSYGSGTIDSSTEQTQSSFFRSNGFHVPFACTVSALQVQASVNGSGGGNIVAALVEYRPSTASGDTNDYPRTVYEEVTVASNNNNSKVATTTIAAADLDATVVPAGSHLVLMVKGDSTTAGDLAVVSMSIGLSW